MCSHDVLVRVQVSLVRKDGINALLDDAIAAERNLEGAKEILYPLMSSKRRVDPDLIAEVCRDAEATTRARLEPY